VRLLYKGRYANTAELLWVIGLLPVSAAVVAVLSSVLRAVERPDQIFWAYVASAVITVSGGIWALSRWALLGAAVGQVAASAATAVALAIISSSAAGAPSRVDPSAPTAPCRDVVMP
jgi:O-antigen/teichoic acid export membrane protein